MLAHWSLSSDDLGLKACLIEHFKAKADVFFVAYNNWLTLFLHTSTIVHAHRNAHTVCLNIHFCKDTEKNKLFSDAQLKIWQCCNTECDRSAAVIIIYLTE